MKVILDYGNIKNPGYEIKRNLNDLGEIKELDLTKHHVNNMKIKGDTITLRVRKKIKHRRSN